MHNLDNDKFEQALEIQPEWRINRHYASKLRLMEVSSQVQEFSVPEKPAP